MKLVRIAAVVAVAVATASPRARADDAAPMFVTVAGSVGVGTSADGVDQLGGSYAPEGVLEGRLTASWEPPPLAYPEPRGYRLAGAIIPEVSLGVIYVADHRTGDTTANTDAMVTIGARLEARLAQRRMGLLRVSMRGGIYLAGRVGFLTDPKHTPLAELALGEHVWLSDTVRIGVEVAGQRVFGDSYAVVPTARTPWRDGDGQYLVIQATGFVGFRL
ncbi:MAG: hypothetical protein R3B06_01245 [Kofleriaceae bacterium]